MANDRITIYKKNQQLLGDDSLKKKVTNEINRMLPELVAASKNEIMIAEQVRIRTNKLTYQSREYISNLKKTSPDLPYSDIIIDLINDHISNKETNIEAKMKNVIEAESATQLYYLKETLSQIDEFLLSLKNANRLD